MVPSRCGWTHTTDAIHPSRLTLLGPRLGTSPGWVWNAAGSVESPIRKGCWNGGESLGPRKAPLHSIQVARWGATWQAHAARLNSSCNSSLGVTPALSLVHPLWMYHHRRIVARSDCNVFSWIAQGKPRLLVVGVVVKQGHSSHALAPFHRAPAYDNGPPGRNEQSGRRRLGSTPSIILIVTRDRRATEQACARTGSSSGRRARTPPGEAGPGPSS